MPFTQQPLPYAYNALEAAIDAQTMEIHYTKHAAAYAKNLAEACVAEHVNTQSTSLENLMKKISKYSPKMRNNGGGHFNHEFFWRSMSASSIGNPSAKLGNAIIKDFGSVEAFKSKFADAGKSRFGSGWAWLIKNNDGKLIVGSTPNQDNPLMDVCELKGTPLLGLDVWEHAYYLRYQNKRPDYINAWWKVVNWNEIEKRFEV
ncbi:MAG: superoxide dismutase [Bacteroidetes bacterium]|nr:superoxide dismutase [Bacteroidota bacterium]